MTWPKATHQKVIGKMNNPFTNWSLMFLDVSRVQYIGKCQTSVWMVSVPIFFLKKNVLILNFLVPWPTKSLPTLFFLKHIAMFGWTTVGWAGHHGCVSLNGYTWSLCTISTYTDVVSCTWTIISIRIKPRTTTSAQRINTYVASCTWTVSRHTNSRTTTSHSVSTPTSFHPHEHKRI